MNFNDLKVGESMSGKSPITIENDKTVSDALSEMKKNNIHQLIVTEDNKIKGTISHKDLLYSSIRDTSTTKITGFVKHSPTISPDKGIIDAAALLISSDTRGLPVVRENELVSIISEYDLVKTVSEIRDNSSVAELMVSPVLTVNQTDAIKKAISIMKKESIHHLPVLKNNETVEGLVSAFDIIKNKEFKTEKMTIGEVKGEQEDFGSLPVSDFMSKLVSHCSPQDTVQDVAKKFIEKTVSSSVVLDKENLVGIVTTKDILRYLVRKSTRNEIRVKISGIKNEDPFIINKVISTAENREEKLEILTKIIDFSIHVKRQHNIHNDRIYIVKTHLDTKSGFYKSTAEDRDLIIALCDSLSKLEERVKKDKTKNMEQMRRKNN
ncbi:MAG: CBS domain-containing protein [Candidatus Diapherotrites archaeon]|nr:CBS domain-containing protein [Candidatus Diapherotrites archaeon]